MINLTIKMEGLRFKFSMDGIKKMNYDLQRIKIQKKTVTVGC